jgi:hypothetical protein
MLAVAISVRASATAAPPTNTTPPSVTGGAQAGSTVSCDPGQWSGDELDFSYQWLDNGQTTGPTTQTWALTPALIGHQIACTVAATSLGSHIVATATSAPVTVTAPAITNTSPPVISGSALPGQTLTCSQGSWSPQPLVYTYQWREDGSPIDGATAAQYSVPAADAGHALSCVVSVALAGGGLGSATSASVTVGPGTPLGLAPPMVGGPPMTGGGPPGASDVATHVKRPLLPSELKPQLIDPYVEGIEVTQGTQQVNASLPGAGLPYAAPLADGLPSTSTPYSGVELAAGQSTVVRVFVANFLAGAVRGAKVTLSVYAGGGLVGTLAPQTTPPVNSQPLGYVTPAERANPGGAWDFLIPASWSPAGSRLTLTARVIPPNNAFQVECADPACHLNDSLSLTGVGAFIAVGRVEVDTFSEGPISTFRPAPVNSVFAAVRALYPGAGSWLIHPPFYYIDTTWIDDMAVTDPMTQQYCGFTYNPKNPSVAAGLLQQCQINQYMVQVVDLETIAKNWNEHIGDISVGIFHNTALRSWAVENAPLSHGGADTNVAAVDESQPIQSVGHEIGHALGLIHSDTACGGGGTPVPASNIRGQLTGYAFEDATTLRIAALPAPPRYVVQTPTDYDMMSYCGSPSNEWISPGHWNQALNTLQAFGAAAAAVRSAGLRSTAGLSPVLPVTAVLSPGGVASVSVGPAVSAPPPLTATAGAEWTLSATGPSGASLGSFGLIPEVIRVDHDLTDPRMVLTGFVPTSVTSVSVLQNGTPVASSTRPAQAPTATLLSPRTGSQRLGAPLHVGWRESGTAKELLLASIDVSADGGRTWRPVAAGIPGTSATIPASTLPPTTNGRLRVQVTDGFNATSSVSGRMRFGGAAPSVTIEQVTPGERVASDQALTLSGEGIADGGTGAALAGRALAWRDGRRVVGYGTSVELEGLTPGLHELTLTARDPEGHSATAGLRVRVTAAAPAVIAITAPASVAAGTRSIAVSIATDEPATLRFGGRSFAVGRAARTVRLGLPRSGTILGLNLTLAAFGQHSTRLVVVSRS